MFTLVASDATLGFAASRLLGGLAFSLGLILVTVAGAELFTGNNLLVMAWASGRVSSAEVLRNWAVVCAANFVGAAGLAVRPCRPEPGRGRAGGDPDRQREGAAAVGRGLFPRRAVQPAGVHGRLDGAGRAQRDRQGGSHRTCGPMPGQPALPHEKPV